MTDLEQFAKDVDRGLGSSIKTLPSKYFYDKKGDALFVEIMHSLNII
ncbi:MAG: L-histidine N-alpha-methyltransferase [Crocinitomix sp.]|jgi:L-histidine N-alpha-methyltransferase